MPHGCGLGVDMLSLPLVALLIVFLVWLILSIIEGGPKGASFWWSALVALAVLFYFGLLRLS
jgi:hypothetical protein